MVEYFDFFSYYNEYHLLRDNKKTFILIFAVAINFRKKNSSQPVISSKYKQKLYIDI